LGTGDEHLLFQSGYIIDLNGLEGTPTTTFYTYVAETGDPGASILSVGGAGTIRYVHILFSGQRILDSDGLLSGNSYRGKSATDVLTPAAEFNLYRAYPELRLFGETAFDGLARPVVRDRAAALLTTV